MSVSVGPALRASSSATKSSKSSGVGSLRSSKDHPAKDVEEKRWSVNRCDLPLDECNSAASSSATDQNSHLVPPVCCDEQLLFTELLSTQTDPATEVFWAPRQFHAHYRRSDTGFDVIAPDAGSLAAAL